jgi:hypothetical protein
LDQRRRPALEMLGRRRRPALEVEEEGLVLAVSPRNRFFHVGVRPGWFGFMVFRKERDWWGRRTIRFRGPVQLERTRRGCPQLVHQVVWEALLHRRPLPRRRP